MMGLFSTFCGLIYNDMMAIPLELFDSCYDSVTGKSLSTDCVYPLGIDPVWYRSRRRTHIHEFTQDEASCNPWSPLNVTWCLYESC